MDGATEKEGESRCEAPWTEGEVNGIPFLTYWFEMYKEHF